MTAPIFALLLRLETFQIPNSLIGVFVKRLQQKTHGAKTVIARKQRRLRIFHPARIKIFRAVRQRHNKRRQSFPRTQTKIFGTLPAVRDENLTFNHVAGIFNRIFVAGNQIVVTNFFDDRDSDFLHVKHLRPDFITTQKPRRVVEAFFICRGKNFCLCYGS